MNRPEKIEWKIEYGTSDWDKRREEILKTLSPNVRKMLSLPSASFDAQGQFPGFRKTSNSPYPIAKYFFCFNNIHVEYCTSQGMIHFFICTGRDANNRPIWREATEAGSRIYSIIYSIEELDEFVKKHFEEIFSAETLSELNAAILNALPPRNDTISF